MVLTELQLIAQHPLLGWTAEYETGSRLGENMRLKLMGIIVCWAVVMCMADSVWGEDSQQPMAQPSASQEAESPSAAQETPSTVKIEDAVVCQDVVDRAPVGSGEVFAKEINKVYCFCRVLGAQPNTLIIHNWYHNGSLKASVKLTVRSSNYRTWSSKTLLPEWDGEWMVEILSEDGTPMESIIFTKH